MLQFIDVRKSFGSQVILDGVSLDIEKGEIFFIIGTSGVGKSVLIKQVIGLLQADSGQIMLDGQDITRLTEREYFPIRKKCAMVFQHATLFDSMTCAENVVLPLRKHPDPATGKALPLSEARLCARELLGQLGMQRFADSYPSELGDGLRKRVAVARALALNPKYMLFDEPTTSLDPVSARQVDALISDLAARKGVTCVVVSHDLRSIFSTADRIAMLYKGKINALGTPAEIKNHSDAVVAQFIQGLPEGPLENP